MKYEIWREAGPHAADTIITLPKRGFSYRLLMLVTRMEWYSAVPASVKPILTILDGSGLPTYGVCPDIGIPPGVSGETHMGVFSASPMLSFNTNVPGPYNGIFYQPMAIPPEVWILPQMQVQLQLSGAQVTGGGSGGSDDQWVDNTLTIARL